MATQEQLIEIRFALRDEVSKAAEQAVAKLMGINNVRFDKVHEGFSGISKLAKEASREIKTLLSITGIGGVVGAGGIVAGLVAAKKGLDDFAQTGLQQHFLARQLGVSTEALENYTDALQVVGQGQSEAAGNVRSALETLEEAYSKGIHSSLFQELTKPHWRGGLELFKEIQEAYAKGPEKALELTVETLARMEKQDVRTAAAFAKAVGWGTIGAGELQGIIGRLIPVIHLSKAELIEYELSNINLDRSWHNVEVTIGKALLPAFTSLNEAIDAYLQSEAGQKLLKDIQSWINSIADTIKAEGFAKQVESVVGGLTTLVKDFRAAFEIADPVVQKLGGWTRVFEALIAVEVVKWILGVVNALGAIKELAWLIRLIAMTPPGRMIAFIAAVTALGYKIARGTEEHPLFSPKVRPDPDNDYDPIFGLPMPRLKTPPPSPPVRPQSYLQEEGTPKTPQEQSADAALDSAAKSQLIRQFAALDYEMDKLNAYLLPGGPEGKADGSSGFQHMPMQIPREVAEQTQKRVQEYITIGGDEVASIRYNNPGAMFPGDIARKYGSEKFGLLATDPKTGQRYKIAHFPTPELGAAANFDLFSQRYTNMSIGAAGKKWTDAISSGIPGYKPSDIITKERMLDPNFAIAVFKSMSGREAGKKSPLTDAQWLAGHQEFLKVQGGGVPDIPKTPRPWPEAGAPAQFPMRMPDIIPSRTTAELSNAQTGGLNSIFAREAMIQGSADVDIDISGVTRASEESTARERLFKPMIIPRTPQMAATGSDRAPPSSYNAA